MKNIDSQSFLKEIYKKCGFFCTYSKVYQVEYSQAQQRYYAFEILRKALKGGKGFTKLGDVTPLTQEQVNNIFNH